MEQQELKETWFELNRERVRLRNQRTDLETELSEVNNKLSHLQEVLNHLAPLSGMNFEESISGLGITDAIRFVLKHSDQRLSAADVRTSLTEQGFDFAGHTAPNASIYKVLNRLVTAEEVEREKDEEGVRVFYKWKLTDEDIPF